MLKVKINKVKIKTKNNKIGEVLFGKAQVRILKLFFKFPRIKFYQSEIAFKTKLPITSTQRILKSLVQIKIIKVFYTRYKTFYQLNSRSKIYKELTNLLNKIS
jgi:DNA-binding MarR family transcriptional regulator